jgi:protein-tyrosine-phosphatase
MKSRSGAMLAGLGMLLSGGPAKSEEGKLPDRIVFVCEHGSVKSLIAMQWFNRRATERGLPLRGISRGVSPDAAVPKGIAESLRQDGFSVETFTPARLTRTDLGEATRVVAIGADVSSVTRGSRVRVDEWTDIPPASENYAASRDAIIRRIDQLMKELEAAREKPSAPKGKVH